MKKLFGLLLIAAIPTVIINPALATSPQTISNGATVLSSSNYEPVLVADNHHNSDYYRSWYNNHYRSHHEGYNYDWYHKHYHGTQDQFYSWYYNHYNHR